ncbi:hypothetical protein pb186bvf_013683 [Paramecium bursaria]
MQIQLPLIINNIIFFMKIIERLRKTFSLEFQNKELEQQYQCIMQKYMLKVVKYYILILIAVQCVAIADQILSRDHQLLFIFIPSLLINCLALYYITSQPSGIIYYQLYIGIISFLASNLQIAFLHLKVFQISDTQFFVYLDLIHQFTLLFNFGQSHYKTSLLYIYFLVTRFYVHIQMGFTSLSIGFLLFSILFFIDQHYKAKQRRKQFLKSKRNKVLEYLIQEFIDEQVCIIQKDETNVKFVPVIINKKLREITEDINKLIQQLKIPVYKNNLQNYLYQSNTEKETLLCQHNQDIYEITYWKYTIKHQKVFIRMKKISSKCDQVVNYKQICQYYQKKLGSIKCQSQNVQRFVSQIRLNTFMFCFHKYYTLYKCNFQNYPYEKIPQLFESKGFKIDSDVMKPLQTDIQLLNLLLNLIKTLMSEKSVFIQQKKNLWLINFYGRFQKNQHQVNQVIQFIDKILFLIGYGSTQLSLEGLITVVIINKKYTKFK